MRRGHDHVAGDRRHAAPADEILAGLEEPGRIGNFDFRSKHFAEEHRADAERQIRIAGGALQIDERRSAAERRADKWTQLAVGRVQSARLGGAAPVDGVWPSDHFAVVAELQQ